MFSQPEEAMSNAKNFLDFHHRSQIHELGRGPQPVGYRAISRGAPVSVQPHAFQAAFRRLQKIKTNLFLLLVATAMPVAALTPADFRVTRDVYFTPLTAAHPVEVRLDAAIFGHIQPNAADLRLFDAADRELPCLVEALRTAQTVTERHPTAAQTRSLQEPGDNRIEIRLDLQENGPAADGITIHTPLKDFIRTVRVSGSDDGKFWRPLVEAEIFGYSRDMDVRNTDIPLPNNSCRHFSIIIRNASEERAQPLIHLVQAKGPEQKRADDLLHTPFRMDTIAFWHETTRRKADQVVMQEWPPASHSVSHNRKDRSTEITLQTEGAPISRLVLETTDRDFQRAARIQVSAIVNGRKTWRTIAAANPAILDLRGYATNCLTMDFSEQRAAQMRLVIDNGANPPLANPAVRAHGPAYRLIWLAQPGERYRIAYGAEHLSTPAYDLSALRTVLDQGIQPNLWQLTPAPDTARPGAELKDVFRRPVVFGGLLAIATLALLVLLAKGLQKTGTP